MMGFKQIISVKAFPSEVLPNVDGLICPINKLLKEIDIETNTKIRDKLISQKKLFLYYSA